MTLAQLVRSKEFTEVTEARVDDKKRVTLKKVKASAKYYKIYVNSAGQIILDPQAVIPASELWLFKNKAALASVRRGLEQSSQGKLVKRPSAAKHADAEIE